jgi:hypothetical protein
MSQRVRDDSRVEATESKFYLPAGTASVVTSRLKRLWTALFSHGVETPA